MLALLGALVFHLVVFHLTAWEVPEGASNQNQQNDPQWVSAIDSSLIEIVDSNGASGEQAWGPRVPGQAREQQVRGPEHVKKGQGAAPSGSSPTEAGNVASSFDRESADAEDARVTDVAEQESAQFLATLRKLYAAQDEQEERPVASGPFDAPEIAREPLLAQGRASSSQVARWAAAAKELGAKGAQEASSGEGGTRARGLEGQDLGGRGAGHANGGSARASHGPLLVSESARCARYFPFNARKSHAEVRLRVDVDEQGHAHGAWVVRSSQKEFSDAAKACARHLLFRPATDERGHAREGRVELTVVFERPS